MNEKNNPMPEELSTDQDTPNPPDQAKILVEAETPTPNLNLRVKEEKTPGIFTLTPLKIALSGIIAALYVLLCLPFASFGFGLIQFRLAEVLTVIPAISAAAVPGVFIGCLLSNILNPNSLGLIDIMFGSLATLLAAFLTHIMAKSYRNMLESSRQPNFNRKDEGYVWKMRFLRFIILLPPVVVNAIVVGTYLPYLLIEGGPEPVNIVASIGSIFLSQTVIVYTLGLGLLLALEKIRLPMEKM